MTNEEMLLEVAVQVTKIFGVIVAIGVGFGLVVYTTTLVSEWLRDSRLQPWVVGAMIIIYIWLALVAMGYFIAVYNNGLD